MLYKELISKINRESISLILFNLYQESHDYFKFWIKYSYDMNNDISQIFFFETHEK